MKRLLDRCSLGIVLAGVLAPATSSAVPVSEVQVSNVVLRAAARRFPATATSSNRYATPFGLSQRRVKAVEPCLHNRGAVGFVVSLEPSGYYLMTLDDELPPWKFYSQDGDFSNLPPGFVAVLKLELAEELQTLASLRSAGKAVDARFHKQWQSLQPTAGPGGDEGDPPTDGPGVYLLTTTWDQDNPYNYYCPTANGGPGGRAYAGCTACALSQILRYKSLPGTVAANHTYNDDKGACVGTHSISDAGMGAYSWANMPNSISAASPLAQQQAIGQLMWHAAVALESDFEKDGTGAYPSSIPSVLETYFQYTSGPYEYKSSYSSAAWYNKIAADIDADRPVFYGMWQADMSGGHAVVCDGYQNGNQIHLNLGWSGSWNGWYNIDTIIASDYTWTVHRAVFGITPPGGGPLANDQCSGAIALANGVPASQSTLNATDTGDPVPPCGTAVGKGVWYTLTPTVSGTVSVSTCASDYDTVLAIYSGTCGGLTLVTCNDDDGPDCATSRASLSFSAAAGTTYYAFVGGDNGAGGNLELVAQWTNPVPNDQCPGATVIAVGETASIYTVQATTTSDPAPTCGSGVGKGVWYKVTPSSSGSLLVSTCGSDYDTVLAVYTGICGALLSSACNDDSSCGGTSTRASQLTFSANAGTTYYLLVGGYNGASGNLQLSVLPVTVPNDTCSGAVALSDNVYYSQNTASAADDTSLPCLGSASKAVWFAFTAPVTAIATVDTCGSAFDTKIEVFTGSCGALSSLVCNDDSSCGLQSLVSFPCTAGVTYLICAGGYGTASGNLQIRAQVSNDRCSGALALADNLYFSQNTTEAADDTGLPCLGTAYHGVWFKYTTPSCPGIVTVDTCPSSFDTKLEVFTGACGALSSIGCNDDACGLQSSLSWNAAADTTYFICAGGYDGASGNLQIRAHTAVNPPANDLCSGALPLTENVQATVNTACASDDTVACLGTNYKAVWFTYTAPLTGVATVDTCASDFDTRLVVFSGSCGGLVALGCNEDSCGLQASVSFPCTAGATYWLCAGGSAGASGNLRVRATSTLAGPFQFTSVKRLPNGQIQLVLSAGAKGGNIVLQASSNLAAGSWVPFATNYIPVGGTATNADLPLSTQRRFYRAIRP